MRFSKLSDSLVEPTPVREFTQGEAGFDDGDVAHKFGNHASDQDLVVSLNVYAPPLR
jgi:hypothetical protein